MASDDEKKSTDDGRSRELSPGKLLVWARERAGLTQEQVAKELYMTLTKVRAVIWALIHLLEGICALTQIC